MPGDGISTRVSIFDVALRQAWMMPEDWNAGLSRKNASEQDYKLGHSTLT